MQRVEGGPWAGGGGGHETVHTDCSFYRKTWDFDQRAGGGGGARRGGGGALGTGERRRGRVIRHSREMVAH